MKKILENIFFTVGITLSILMNIFFLYLFYQNEKEKYEKYGPGGGCPDYAPLIFTYKYDLEYADKDCNFKNLKEELEKTYFRCDSGNKKAYYQLTLNLLSKTKCGNTGGKIYLEKYLLSNILQNITGGSLNLNLSGDKLIFSGNIQY